MVIISQFPDDLRQPFTKKTGFQKIIIKDNIVHLEGMHFSAQFASWSARLMSLLNKIPLYDQLSKISHLLYLIRLNLNKTQANNNFLSSQTDHLDQFLKSITDQQIKKLMWKQGNFKFHLPKEEDNPIHFYGSKIGLSSSFDLESASSPQGNQSTGFSLCWRR